MNSSVLDELIDAIGGGLARPAHAWSAAVIAVALAVAWLVASQVRARTASRVSGQTVADVLKFSIEGFRRLAFPVAALLLLAVAEFALRKAGVVHGRRDAQLLRLAMILLGALALIRLLVYAVQRVFPRAALIGAFERTIALAVWLLVALHVVGWLDDIVEWLHAESVPLGSASVTLWALAAGTLSILAALLVALWIGAAVEAKVLMTESMDLSLRVVLGRLARAVIVIVALLVALSAAGIDLTLLSVFGGALGVGLGLGLQRIASSYVSGFIILLDRSLRIGDLISVDKFSGVVAQIRSRYTVVRALDGAEALIPNDMLVSSPVTNLSFSDKRLRLAVKVSVDYEADVKAALALMEDAARSAPRVLADPAPMAMLLGFGADGLDLEVGFWIIDPEQGRGGVQSDVAQGVLARFREAGIGIPYPQRDVRITGWSGPQADT